MFIDIHSHRTGLSSNTELRVSNVIVSKDYLNSSPCSAGIHPWYIDEDQANQLEALEQYLLKKEVIALGECGLDKVVQNPWNIQVEVFEKQITLANKYQKPLIIHCVRAYSEVCTSLMRMKVQVPVIFHGFNKNWTLANTLIKQGYYISLGHAIQLGKMNELIEQVPLDRIFFETDDKPIKISNIYAYFCRVRKNIPLEVLQRQLRQNFIQAFNYSL